MHRNEPILMGAIPAVPPNDNTFYLGTYRCGAVWNQLEAAGIPEVKGVWAHEAGGSRFMLTVSRSRRFTAATPSRPAWSRHIATLAPTATAGPSSSTTTSIPTNFNDVIWAMCTRCDPRDQVDIIHGGWSSALDPMCYDTEDDRRNSRVVIDACIPFNRKKTFPDDGPIEQGARRPHAREMGEGAAERVLSRSAFGAALNLRRGGGFTPLFSLAPPSSCPAATMALTMLA